MSLPNGVKVGERLVLQEVETGCFAFVREGCTEPVPIRAGLRLRVSLPAELSPKFDKHKTVRADVPRFGGDALIYLDIGRSRVALHELGPGVIAEVLCLGELYGGVTDELQRVLSVQQQISH